MYHLSVQLFTVADNGFRRRLAFAERKRLQHHEEVQPVLRRELLSDLQNAHIVLDDTHHVEALRALKLAYVPVYYIEYEDPHVQIGRWFRTNAQCKPSGLKRLLEQLGMMASFSWNMISGAS